MAVQPCMEWIPIIKKTILLVTLTVTQLALCHWSSENIRHKAWLTFQFAVYRNLYNYLQLHAFWLVQDVFGYFFCWDSLHAKLKVTTRPGITRKRSAIFLRQRIWNCSCAGKETVDIDILVTSGNVDRKIMQSIRITSRPLKKKEVEPVEPVQVNIYQGNTYRKDLSWLPKT